MSNEILVELEDHIEKEEVMHEKTFHTKEVSKLIEKHFSGGNLRKIEKRKTNKILLSDLEDTGSNILKKNSLITLNESDPISTNDSVQDYILKPVNQLEKTKDSQEKPSFETSRVYYEKDTLLISSKLKSVFEQVLHIPYEDLDEEATFVDIGLDSISGVEAIRLINEEYKINLEAVVLYDYYNIEELSELIIKKSDQFIHVEAVPSKEKENIENSINSIKEYFEESREHIQKTISTESIITELKGVFEMVLHIPLEDLDEGNLHRCWFGLNKWS